MPEEPNNEMIAQAVERIAHAYGVEPDCAVVGGGVDPDGDIWVTIMLHPSKDDIASQAAEWLSSQE